MNFRRLFCLLGLVLAIGGVLAFLPATPVMAQVDAGFQEVGAAAQLGTADPRIIAARIINIFLGTLGTILLCLVLYAGFLWMTAGGDAERVEKAQKTIRNAIIGLIIIVCSWGFVTFILNKLLDATRGSGGFVATSDNGGGGGELGAAGGSLAFNVRSITPSGPIRIRNAEVRFLLSREVLASSATSSITVVRASDEQPVEGTVTVADSLVTFVPTQACPAPNGNRKCFAENTDYIARVGRGLRSRSGLTVACGRTAPPCEGRFRTGSLVDVSSPNSAITNPLDGQGIPLGDTVRVTVRSRDDGGISITEVLVDGRMIGRDAATATTTPLEYDATVNWDTRGVATGTHRIEARVFDIDSNSVTTTPITVAVRPRSYFNGVQDNGAPEVGCGGPGQPLCVGSACTTGRSCLSGLCEGGVCRARPETETGCGGPGQLACIGAVCTRGDGCLSGRCEGGICRGRGETGVDCGGAGGGACAGAMCTRGVDCASGLCVAGRCIEQPIIGSFNPVNGRPGTYVTISGVNFGTTTGQVTFGGRLATAPASCGSSTAFWSPTQIVVAVPEGATTSTIQVTHATNRMTDATNDERGPRLADFVVNGVARPGLCVIRPGTGTVGDRSRLAVAGVNLGSTAGRLFFNDHDVAISAWRPTGVDLTAPLVPPGAYSVRARIGELESNPVGFHFNDRVITAPPIIDQLRPATGTVGSYVTLLGRNFGSGGRVFFRNPLTNAIGEADTRFPAQCGSTFWADTSVMIKVPRALRGGLGEEQAVRGGAYEIYLQRDGITQSNRVPFTVFDGAPGPGVCSIQPIAGPVGTGVTIYGERFGSVVGAVSFAGTTSSRPLAFLSSESWRDGEIRTRVPTGALTGGVRVTVAGQDSNDAFFSVANCVSTPGICGPSLACCPDGSCAVAGTCRALGVATSTFAWRSSTGRLYQSPRVVEECNNELPPSPSPRSLSTCVNAQAVVRFTTHIEASTINPSNVIIRRCTGRTGDPCATGTPEVVSGRLVLYTGLTQDHFVFTPAGGVWAPSSTYQVILTTGITTPRTDGSRRMLENAELYGRGNAYMYRFTTKDSRDLCTAGSVSVVPHSWLMENIGDIKDDYTLSARAAGDICVQINADTLGWNWSVSDAGRARVTPNNRVDSSSSTVEGLGATAEPVQITAELTTPPPPAPVRGSGNLTVRLTPPRVISYAPNCNEACVNAAVWARFNVAMDRANLFRTVGGVRVPNIEIKRCTNESCRETDLTLDLSEAIIDLITPAGSFATDTMMKVEPSIAGRDPDTGESIRISQLDPGRFYKATIIGGLEGMRSAYGRLPLTGLNESDPVGFTWKFRVKAGAAAHCTPVRVEVVPSVKYEVAFGLRQLFIASPISAPDSCSRDGQMLISERNTTWSRSDARVADFVRIGGGRASVALADRLPNHCTNQCLNAGSDGVYGRTAICGNETVETTDVNYCVRRSDRTRECLVGNPDCVTRQDSSKNCLILPEGSQDSEECDLGRSNGTGASCSTSCLWNPRARVTDLAPGTCGNGSLQIGEQCDPGRSCVGGSTPGRDCTRDTTVCGTGGTCQVVERRGCSDRCQALGAARGGSTCGNGDVSDGETCDYRAEGTGSGCTDQCLHRGSVGGERRLCGNGRIELGETCEMRTPGDATSAYCHMVAGVMRCFDGTHFSDLCDAKTCLKQGTPSCPRFSATACCGNGGVEPGEDCDGGPGCSARCLMQGSSPAYPEPSLCGDRVVGTGEQCDAPPVVGGGDSGPRFEITNRQLFEIVGLREPTETELRDNAGRMSSNIGARYMNRDGSAIYGVQCNFTQEADCRTVGTGITAVARGLTSGGCCAVRPTATVYPAAGARDVCRNVLISSTFNQLMNEGTIRGNFLVSTQSLSSECPTGTSRLDRAVPTAFNWRAPFRSFVAKIKSWFAPVFAQESVLPWCSGVVRGSVTFEQDETSETPKTRAVFLLDEALNASTTYRVTLLGDPSIRTASTSSTRRGIRGANGIYADGNITWDFSTGDRICTIDEVRIVDTYPSHPTLFYKSNERHRYIARAVSHHLGQIVPLSPIPGLYSWGWRDWASSRPNILSVTPPVPTTPQISHTTTTAQNQRGTSLIATGVTITADRVSSSTTAGQSRSSALLSTVLLCDNPWIPPGVLPGQAPRFEDQEYHFSFYYCLDAGQTGPGDDLPQIVVNRLEDNASDVARGIKRQYIFSFANPAFRSDAIGVRIMANPLHLSPKDWYVAQGFSGAPQATTVDGYEAIRDGSTLYVGAANITENAGDITTDIYVLSHNPNASTQIRTIFEQVVDGFTFNTNVLNDADNTCRTRTGDLFRLNTTSTAITCTADWECVRLDRNGYCASSKEKLQRDLKRMADLQYMAGQLEAAKRRDGKYPTIQNGTFLQTIVNSRWPSWQSVFAQAVGKALPEDPLNVHVSCGQCLASRQACMEDSDCGSSGDRCVAVQGFDPSTCWNAVSSTYRCPILEPTNAHSVSRLYQYRSVDGGNRYELGTELEYQAIGNYTPSILPETRRCVSDGASNGRLCIQDSDCNVMGPDRLSVIGTGVCTAQGGRLQFGGVCLGRSLGLGGICGDGVVGTNELCEPSQTRQGSCPIAGGASVGRIDEVCRADCSGFTAAPGATCVPRIQCGNGRVEDGESCDDGDLNGRYGHCDRSCRGFSAMCGDGQLSPGETCDLGDRNGAYCDTSGYYRGAACALNQTCGVDCRSVSGHCGDGVVQTESIGDGGQVEQCDGNAPERYTGSVCSAGATGQACDPRNQGSDCASGPISGSDLCGRNPQDRACSGIQVGLCAGGIVVDGVSRDRQVCTCPPGQTSCTSSFCGAAYRCIMYETQRTRSCAAPQTTIVPGATRQCHWNPWSACLPANYCGDGIIDTGEACDDGNRNDNDACTNRCLANVCGDGVMNVGAEECDYGRGNGQGCTGADYGSTCAACTDRCRMTASSGGYCGNAEVDGAEQCDGADFNRAAGVQSAAGLTCTGLGFDYAEQVRCAHDAYMLSPTDFSPEHPNGVVLCTQREMGEGCVEGAIFEACSLGDGCTFHPASTTPQPVPSEFAAQVCTGPRTDIISCARTCGYSGCQTCTASGSGVINGSVRDAVYSDRAVAGATVSLLRNGRRVATQTTNSSGSFSFSGLNSNTSCGGYRVFVEFTRDNPATSEYNEGANGGYWTYESDLFSVSAFTEEGIHNEDGIIYLIPRVANGESMVVHAWNRSLGGRFLLAHLILPANRSWNWGTPFTSVSCPSGPTYDTRTGATCQRDIHEQDNGGGFQGVTDLAQIPHARLFCPRSTVPGAPAGACFTVNNGPQAIRYRLSPLSDRTGTFSFYLSDQRSTASQNATMPSYRFYQETQSRVWVVTHNRIYQIDPPDGPPGGVSRPRCSGKYWLVYQQDVATGEVTIRRDQTAYQCGGELIPGEPPSVQASRLPDTNWASGGSSSWLHFGGIPTGFGGIDWDMPRY